jgi:hypothetical protein
MAQVEEFILQIKFPSLNLPGQCDIKICQVHVVSLQDEVTIVERLDTKADPLAHFPSGGPVQLSAHEGFAKEPYHSHLSIGHHVKVTTDTVASVWRIGVAVSSRN